MEYINNKITKKRAILVAVTALALSLPLTQGNAATGKVENTKKVATATKEQNYITSRVSANLAQAVARDANALAALNMGKTVGMTTKENLQSASLDFTPTQGSKVKYDKKTGKISISSKWKTNSPEQICYVVIDKKSMQAKVQGKTKSGYDCTTTIPVEPAPKETYTPGELLHFAARSLAREANALAALNALPTSASDMEKAISEVPADEDIELTWDLPSLTATFKSKSTSEVCTVAIKAEQAEVAGTLNDGTAC